MPETIVCAICGHGNPPDAEYCQNCQSRLEPQTRPLNAEDAPIQPGHAPAKKVRSELEPVLPLWLREAPPQARHSVQEKVSNAEQEKKLAPVSRVSNLSARLISQSQKGDDQIPNWLAGINGRLAKRTTPEPEETQTQWAELARGEEPAASIEYQLTLPHAKEPESAAQRVELTDWPEQNSVLSDSASSLKTGIDLTNPLGNESSPAFSPGGLEWLKRLDPGASVPGLGTAGLALPADNGTPDWVQSLGPTIKVTAERVPGDSSVCDQGGQSPFLKEEHPTPQANLPAWLKNVAEDSRAATDSKPSVSNQVHSDWSQAPAASGEIPPPETSESVPENAAPPDELPDGISSLKPVESQAFGLIHPAGPTLKPEQPRSESAPLDSTPAASSFKADSMTGVDVEAIFASLRTPEWLFDVVPGQLPDEVSVENLLPAVQPEEPILPAELPSWVQTMRPMQPDVLNSQVSMPDIALEVGGALAGMHGVLPAIPGAATSSSKPKFHSILLDVSEQQQAHFALLEKILAEETAPIPIQSASAFRSQRALRWAISAVLFVVVGAFVLAGTHYFPLPGQIPSETLTAIQAIEAIPADAPVLVVFDYEPSTVGEMEATAASLMDHLLLLKHPHLALVSTSPTGAALAEHFITTTLANRIYQRGVQFEDLGYLPGGLVGVYDFGHNPAAVVPLGADSRAVWQSPMLQGVTHLADFAAIIVLTDNVDSGRVWIEQTASARGSAPLVIVSSAQAGPMLYPYVESGQLRGLVSGLSGAAGVEQANVGLPGYVRRYWDAYSVGLLLASVLILMGGIWNLLAGHSGSRHAKDGLDVS